jgi:hypothetical protein
MVVSVVLFAEVAQLVEQRTENPRVGSSILPLGTTFLFFLIFEPHLKIWISIGWIESIS